MIAEVGRVLFRAARTLEKQKLRYAVVGGLAVGAWGVNRSTRDADFYAELPDAARPGLRLALEKAGFHVPAMDEELETYGVFRSRSREGIFLDIFSAVGPLGEAVLERRRQIALGGKKLWFIAPEDLAVLKAFSDRARDFEDLVGLAGVVGAKLDRAYVRRWAKKLDASIGGDEITERVERAFAPSKPRRRK